MAELAKRGQTPGDALALSTSALPAKSECPLLILLGTVRRPTVELPRHKCSGKYSRQQRRDLVRIAGHDRCFDAEQGVQSDPCDGCSGSAVRLVAALGRNPEATPARAHRRSIGMASFDRTPVDSARTNSRPATYDVSGMRGLDVS